MGRFDLVNADSGEKTFITPKHIVDACGHFDTDPCVADIMPWRTADLMITKAEDGLIVPWKGRVWLNPPYGREAVPFLKKMVDHVHSGGSGIALIFVRTDNRAWHDLIFPHAKGFLFLRGRIAFCDSDGIRRGGNCTYAVGVGGLHATRPRYARAVGPSRAPVVYRGILK